MTETATHREKLEFKTELKQLLHIITHSLYSHKEIFLRELISNASDAINRIKFDSLEHEDRLEGNKDWKIKLLADREKGTLTISDNGIGMNRDHVIENLGTIAKSGTRAFLEHIKQQSQQAPELIGQFGVGFYSAFMVADKVTVRSRMAGDPRDGVEWTSDGQGEYTIETIEKPSRGTEVILHLKDDCKEFLEEWRLRELVKKFSDFLEHPVVMDVEKTDENNTKTIAEETLNARTAIWLRRKSEVTQEEYTAFYKQISNDFAQPPARIIHYTAEGSQEFKVLLFIPGHRPMEFDWGEVKAGPRLYIQRVLIMDQCEELLPSYLRFVKGVVDSSDLPLNISRELLQQNPMLAQMQKNLVRSVLKDLQDFRNEDKDGYIQFHRELGSILKEGVGRDWNNREKIADLLLFESIKTDAGKYITLNEYVEAMPADQKEIYYLTGESREQIEHSPYLEAFRARGQDVLLLTDPVDEFMVHSLGRYKDKTLQAVDRSELAQDREGEASKPEVQERFKALLAYCKEKLSEVSDVRLSQRLKESATCLVAAEGSMTAHMERLMQRLGRGEAGMAARRVLELNPEHPTIQAIQKLHAANAEEPRLESYVRLLYEEAVLAEGSRVKDPVAFARRINELIARDAG